MLVEAAWQLVRRDAAMLEHYKTLTRRMKGQDAIIRIARKLLRRIRAVMLCERMYVVGVNGKLTREAIVAAALPAQKKREDLRKFWQKFNTGDSFYQYSKGSGLKITAVLFQGKKSN